MFVRLMTVIFLIAFGSSLIWLWNWIGNQFTDAPAQASLGLSPGFVGMIIFFIVFYGGLFIIAAISRLVMWVVKGV